MQNFQGMLLQVRTSNAKCDAMLVTLNTDVFVATSSADEGVRLALLVPVRDRVAVVGACRVVGLPARGWEYVLVAFVPGA